VLGVSAASKVYDSTTKTSLTGTPTVNALGGDALSVSGGSANFTDKNVGTGKAVTVVGYALSGAAAANYTLSQPTGLTANITPATSVISGVSALGKMIDGTTAASLTGSPIATKLGSDVVNVSGTGVGNFADKEVGVDKPVTVQGYVLSGADAANYTAVQPTGLVASITPQPVVIIAPPAATPVAAAPVPVPVVSGAATVAVAVATPGVIINLVRTPTSQGTGVVDVIVPSGSANTSSSLVIPLPEQIVPASNTGTGSNQTVIVTKTNGDQLPDWIVYNPLTRSFDVGVAPEGAYPLQVQVSVGGQITVIQISESTKK
jgi:hypothetical protein